MNKNYNLLSIDKSSKITLNEHESFENFSDQLESEEGRTLGSRPSPQHQI